MLDESVFLLPFDFLEVVQRHVVFELEFLDLDLKMGFVLENLVHKALNCSDLIDELLVAGVQSVELTKFVVEINLQL